MPTDPVRTVTGIRLHCPLCKGGPHEVPEGGSFACFDCHTELVVVRSCGFVMLMWHEDKEGEKDG